MSIARRSLARVSRLDRREWRLLLQAIGGLAGANLLLVGRSFQDAVKFGAVPLGSRRTGADAEAIVWAVRAASRRVPFRAKCIEQGIVAQRMMRRAGIDARLHYGARTGPDAKPLSAHVWVTVGGQAVIGGEEAAAFAELSSYP